MNNRRAFLIGCSRFGIAATLAQANLVVLAQEPTKSASATSNEVYDKNAPQSRLSNIVGNVNIGHPARLGRTKYEPGILFDGSIIKFESNGSVMFPSGRTFHGKKGDKFKLLCIRDTATKRVVRQKLVKGMSLDELRNHFAARRIKEGR